MIQMQIMSAHHTPDLEETTSITNPKSTVDIRESGLYDCWEKQSRTLTVCSYAGWHQAKGLLHRTSIALSLARGLSQSDRLFPSVQKNNKQNNKQNKTKKLAWIPIQKTRSSRQAVQEVLQSMLNELCKCQQTRRCPGEDGLQL